MQQRVRDFQTLVVGYGVEIEVALSEAEVNRFIELSGDDSAIHLSDDYAISRGFDGRVVHGVLLCAFYSRIIGTILPGDNALLLDLGAKFHHPVYINQKLVVTAEVADVYESVKCVVLKLLIRNDMGLRVCSGNATVRIG